MTADGAQDNYAWRGSMSSEYRINGIRRLVHGEGYWCGSAMVFLRFADCNLSCSFCDTEWSSATNMSLGSIMDALRAEKGICGRICLTGGEPLLQVDAELMDAVQREFSSVHLETNGTLPLPSDCDHLWVASSPHTAEHTLRLQRVDELRYVRMHGQGIPIPKLAAKHLFISPVWQHGGYKADDIAWCRDLVLNHPGWRLSLQAHRGWEI